MTIQFDHTGISPVTLKAPNSGTITRIVLPGGTPLAGQSLTATAFAGGVLSLGLDTVTGLPTGGTSGQLLRRTSSSYEWYTQPPALPSGGTTGQALVKASASDYDATWQTISGGGIGGSLDLGDLSSTTNVIDLGAITDSLSTSPLTLILQPGA
jgi:hypothetical protein